MMTSNIDFVERITIALEALQYEHVMITLACDGDDYYKYDVSAYDKGEPFHSCGQLLRGCNFDEVERVIILGFERRRHLLDQISQGALVNTEQV